MGMFKDMLKDSESLFLNEMALDVDYVPPIIRYRENQQQYIATCIKPLLQNRNGKNLFITGKPGIGKTVAIKHLLDELNKETDEIKTIYINCWKKDTGFKIVNEICEILGYKWVHNKGTDELLKEITGILNKKAAVIVLDEVDKLNEPEILYNLVEDVNKKSILIITNEEDFLIDLDSRIRSRLMAETLKFNPYNKEETKGILKQRISYAFSENVLQDDAFNLIVDKTCELEDIRSGLFLMKEAGLIAESESSKRILLKHAQKAKEKLRDFKIKKSSDLDDEEKAILNLIKENSGKSITELYKVYSKNNDKTYRTFLRKIRNLEKNKLISTMEESGKRAILVNYSMKKLNEF